MRVLAICAHPDDAEILCGGTLARYAERGDEVTIAIATSGEQGSQTLSPSQVVGIRRSESLAAAAILNAKVEWLGFRDGFIKDEEATRISFINVMRKTKPDVVLTHWPDDLYSPDHTITGQLANDMAIMTTVPNIKTECPPSSKIPVVYFIDSMAGLGFQPEEYVDVSNTFTLKIEALRKHESQVCGWLQDQYDSNILDVIETVGKFRGLQSQTKYAEGFIRAKAYPRNVTGSLLP